MESDSGDSLSPKYAPETTAPTGYDKDTDTTRVITVVDQANLAFVVGTQDTDNHDYNSGNCDGEDCDFHNRLGSIAWEKYDDLEVLQGGAIT